MRSTRMPRAARSGATHSRRACRTRPHPRLPRTSPSMVASRPDRTWPSAAIPTPSLRPSTSDLPADAAPLLRRRSALWLPVAAAFLCAALARPAGAASFSVDPTLITLSPRASSTLLVVRNESPQPVRLQVSAVAWSQGLEGDMQVQPTEDLVFFPSLFTLEPGQDRKVRVGTTANFGAAEKSYRLFLEQLPPATREAD